VKQRQHAVVTHAVLKHYSLPPEYVVYSIWPDYVPKLAVRRIDCGGVTFPIAVREPHHNISKRALVEEFLMNVSDYKRGSSEDRKGALVNTMKLLHYVQDGCILHRYEEDVALVPLDQAWIVQGEELAARLPEGAREKAEALAGEVYSRLNDREAVRAAAALSSAAVKAFLESAGWHPRV